MMFPQKIKPEYSVKFNQNMMCKKIVRTNFYVGSSNTQSCKRRYMKYIRLNNAACCFQILCSEYVFKFKTSYEQNREVDGSMRSPVSRADENP